MYWKLISRATKPKVKKVIGPLKRDNGLLQWGHKEKADLMNSFFCNIGEKLVGNVQSHLLSCSRDTLVPRISDISVSHHQIEKKINLLQKISAKLLKLVGSALVQCPTACSLHAKHKGRWSLQRLEISKVMLSIQHVDA